MAIKTTRWSPDTCDCTIEYQWDDTVSADLRVHVASRIVKACSFHQGHPNATSHYATLIDENRRKNHSIEKLRKDYPELSETVNQDGETFERVKKGSVSWSFDNDRVLKLSIPSLTVNKKNTANADLATEFGVGKVEIV